MTSAMFSTTVAAVALGLAAGLAQTQAAPAKTPDLWLDTDLACGSGVTRDVDDCVALLAVAIRAPGRLAGITLTYGNAPLRVVQATAQRLAPLWAQQTGQVLIAVPGAAARRDCSGNAASAALIAASRRASLTVLAIGPLTNLACAFQADPALARRLRGVVVVGGAAAGHVFHPAEGARGAVLGHGPIARDLNVQLDPVAAEQVLRSGVQLTLVPYQAARGISLTGSDLEALGRTGPLGAAVAQDARPWLETWRTYMGRDGFNPFDLLAVAAVLEPDALRCGPAPARVTADQTISGNRFGPRRLIVGRVPWQGERATSRQILWCGALADTGVVQIKALTRLRP